MRVSLLLFLVGLLAAGCGKTNPPLKVYFVGSSRYTTANRTASAADTLATRLYFDDNGSDPAGLKNLRVTVDYEPFVRPFAYPNPLTGFLFSSVAGNNEQLVYLDTTYANPPIDLLYTAVFGVRTSSGNERWTFTMSDKADNSVARSFIIKQRRADSLAVYNEYPLKLASPPIGKDARRYLDFEDGLALPGHALNTHDHAIWQSRVAAVLLSSGSLASPDVVTLDSARWLPTNQRPRTRFTLTVLNSMTLFNGILDTASIHQQFTAPGTSSIQPGTNQVYAFRTDRPGQKKPLFGLLFVASTTVGLQLQVRTAKQPL